MMDYNRPFACLGPYLLETYHAAQDAGREHLAAFAREQWERHRDGGVYVSFVFFPEAFVVPVEPCPLCAGEE